MRNLLFSSANEDGQAERDALQLGHADVVLCICGSGARPLELLLARPKRIVVVDWSIEQIALTQLKLQAIAQFDPQDALRFLGVLPTARDRFAMFELLAPDLDARSAAIWRAQRRWIEKGVIYAGRWEQLFRLLNQVGRPFLGRYIDRLFAATSISEQEEVWRQVKRSPWWRSAIGLLGMRAFWAKAMREPGIEYVPPHINLGLQFESYLDGLMNHRLVASSPFAWLVFYGRYGSSGPWPDHLQPDNLAIIAATLASRPVDVVCSSLTDYLRSSHETFSAFSLSDISSYASGQAHADLWHGVLQRSRDGARFCERLFLGYRQLPSHIGASITRFPDLERSLAIRDSSFCYRFAIGTIRQSSQAAEASLLEATV